MNREVQERRGTRLGNARRSAIVDGQVIECDVFFAGVEVDLDQQIKARSGATDGRNVLSKCIGDYVPVSDSNKFVSGRAKLELPAY